MLRAFSYPLNGSFPVESYPPFDNSTNPNPIAHSHYEIWSRSSRAKRCYIGSIHFAGAVEISRTCMLANKNPNRSLIPSGGRG